MKKIIIMSVSCLLIFSCGFAQQKKSTQSRSAKSGRYVTKSYADRHKATTVTSRRKKN